MRNVISLYTGVGGLDFGFEAAGFQTRVAVEMDRAAVAMLRLNRPWVVLDDKIQGFTSEQILRAAQLAVGETDVLIGGPPCQPFSKSGYWVNGDSLRLDDPRSDTLSEYLRVLRDTQPRAFLLENVHGLAFKNKDEGLKHLLSGIEQINREVGTNYRVFWRVLNAASFGVPQIRERVFLIASREGKTFTFPEPRFVKAGNNGVTKLPSFRTAWDAIGDLPKDPNEPGLIVGGKWGDLLPSIPEGHNYLWHTNRGGGESLFGWRTRYWSFLLKLAKDQPSWTIQAQPGSAIGPFHWLNRRLSSKELSRLQTFPEDIGLVCSRADVQRLIGNAVPSLLAELLAREIRRQFFGEDVDTSALTLLPPVRTDRPGAERLRPIAPKYEELISEYADHPGEGLGAGVALFA